MARIVFYCNDERNHLQIFEYYQQDIEGLRALGHEVVVCTRYRQIPLRFDALFIWWWTYAALPVLACRLLGRPVIVTGVFNFQFPEHHQGRDYFRRPRWQRVLISIAVRLANLNLFIDETEFHRCREFFGLTNARLSPCSIHEDYLRGPAERRELELLNLAWSGKENLVRKGIPELIEAMSLLKRRGVAARLSLAGPAGDGLDGLLARIKALGLEDSVRWIGPLDREDKITRMQSTEIYVQPSHYEGFGLATAEAMGCGALIVTCDVGAVRSVVGECGLYVPPGAPDALADAIERSLTNAAVRRELQQCGVARARQRFDPGEKRHRLAGFLRELGIPSRPASLFTPTAAD
jgi:glycosyltransferase involved in cell wall biosynthesis